MFMLSTLKNLWLKFAHAAGRVNTRIILTLVYILLGIPAIVLKLIRKDLLKRKKENVPSYWENKERAAVTHEQAKHQF